MCKCQTWGVRGENTDSTRCPIHGVKKMTEHEELLAIHAICMDVANCPEEKEGDTLTVKMVKRMAIFASTAPIKDINTVTDVLQLAVDTRLYNLERGLKNEKH